MAGIFDANEIFQIAMELEQTGQVFYEALAIGCGNDRVAALCRRLAKQEVDHYNTFKAMREALVSGPDVTPLTGDDLDFAQALVSDRIIPSPDEARKVAATGGVAEALDLAIRLEKDSVLFYGGIAGAVGAKNAGAIAGIVAEEKRHVRDLLEARKMFA